ncbi:50S ribosomal protein L35 [candidate division WWE3 bacterium]|uniref:50S ribosomal protein L35 n=1 Tax=candidate division WWE3 bacterium TaxID=2053526 RepID=A0A955RRR7_UNCKA|nr:50S ribosomal protein L35 [candidate division WWE3 bacterium]
MPKMKTHKGAAKRIKVTGGAVPKILRRKRVIGKNAKARTATLRQNRKMVTLDASNVRVFKKLIPGV